MSAGASLKEKIRQLIAADGPISVGHFMALALGDPDQGYYRTRDPFGADGDFVTAPEISQMFGELLGLWSIEVWRRMGSPAAFAFIELGPGRGTLMADALRAARLDPAFLSAARVHLVETSPHLRKRQEATLANSGATIVWHTDLSEVPAAPSIVIANEFFDALPIFQAVRTADGWRERMVGLDASGELQFGLNPNVIPATERPPLSLERAPLGGVFEWRANAEAEKIFSRLKQAGGAALIIDYGHAESGFGDTLQAVRRHRYADPLEAPGEDDLTAHVDFGALRRAASAAEVAAHGPVTQGRFLRALGIEQRAMRLKSRATSEQVKAIDAAVSRLANEGPDEMGELFKVLGLSASLGQLPGFDK